MNKRGQYILVTACAHVLCAMCVWSIAICVCIYRHLYTPGMGVCVCIVRVATLTDDTPLVPGVLLANVWPRQPIRQTGPWLYDPPDTGGCYA